MIDHRPRRGGGLHAPIQDNAERSAGSSTARQRRLPPHGFGRRSPCASPSTAPPAARYPDSPEPRRLDTNCAPTSVVNAAVALRVRTLVMTTSAQRRLPHRCVSSSPKARCSRNPSRRGGRWRRRNLAGVTGALFAALGVSRGSGTMNNVVRQRAAPGYENRRIGLRGPVAGAHGDSVVRAHDQLPARVGCWVALCCCPVRRTSGAAGRRSLAGRRRPSDASKLQR